MPHTQDLRGPGSLATSVLRVMDARMKFVLAGVAIVAAIAALIFRPPIPSQSAARDIAIAAPRDEVAKLRPRPKSSSTLRAKSRIPASMRSGPSRARPMR